MASLRDQFGQFYPPDEHAIATALRTGLVTPDTNVLLSLYRFQPEARDELFSALEEIGDRLWIPHQVAVEFHRKRLSVIASQENYFSKTGDQLESRISGYLEELRAFAARISLPKSTAEQLEGMISKAHQAVKEHVVNAGEANEVHLDNRDSDDILSRLEVLFTDRVGDPMERGEFEAACKEALRRVKEKIPPGYMDRDKPDPSGDYLIWRQLMTEAAKRKLPVAFITDDRKEDWYRREHGLTLGARYELREEMLIEAGVSFLIMTTSSFLIHAGQYLHVSVSPETVSQAEELPDSLADELSKLEEQHRKNLQSLLRRRRETNIQIELAQHEIRALEKEMMELFNGFREGQLSEEEVSQRTAELGSRMAESREILQNRLERIDEIDAMLASPPREAGRLGLDRLGEFRLG